MRCALIWRIFSVIETHMCHRVFYEYHEKKRKMKIHAISCDPRKSTESRIDPRARLIPRWFNYHSWRFASHRISRWKDVQLFEYVPIKKSELRYTRFYLPLPVFPATPALSSSFFLCSSCFLRSRRSLLLLVFASRQEKKGRREIGIPGFFASNYFTASFLKH